MFKYIVVLFIIFFCEARDNRIPGKYDKIILAQNLPLVTFANEYKIWPNKSTNIFDGGLDKDDCALLFRERKWIAHGLWPYKPRGAPTFCRRGERTKTIMKYIAPDMDPVFRSQLKTTWPDLTANITKTSIWSREWSKHGTCLTDQDSMNTVRKYFFKTVKLLKKYNVGNILEEHSILPGNEYTLDAVVNAIKTFLGTLTIVRCLPLEISGIQKQYLFEVQICFNKTIHLMDCHGNGTFNCDINQKVVYPKWEED